MCFAEQVCAVRLRGENREETGGGETSPGTALGRGCGGKLMRREQQEMVKEKMRGIGKEMATEWRSRVHALILSLAKQTSS